MRFLVFFSLVLMSFLGLAQQDTNSIKVTMVNDSMFLIALKIGKTVVEFHKEKTLDTLEQDSLKRNIIPLRWREKFAIDAIKKRFEMEEATFKKGLKNLENASVPDFDAKDTEGVLHRPANYFGRVLILHFWNFWDGSFENEIPALQQLLAKYQHHGFQILSFVDLEIGENEKSKLAKSPLDFPLIQNSRSFMSQFIKIRHSTPYLILVDKQGKMCLLYVQHELNFKKSGFYNGDFEAKIKELLSEN